MCFNKNCLRCIKYNQFLRVQQGDESTECVILIVTGERLSLIARSAVPSSSHFDLKSLLIFCCCFLVAFSTGITNGYQRGRTRQDSIPLSVISGDFFGVVRLHIGHPVKSLIGISLSPVCLLCRSSVSLLKKGIRLKSSPSIMSLTQ